MTTDVELLIINYWCWYCIVDVDIELKKTISNKFKQSSLGISTEIKRAQTILPCGLKQTQMILCWDLKQTQTILPWDLKILKRSFHEISNEMILA